MRKRPVSVFGVVCFVCFVVVVVVFCVCPVIVFRAIGAASDTPTTNVTKSHSERNELAARAATRSIPTARMHKPALTSARAWMCV